MKRYIPIKNYIIAAITILLVIALSLYFYRWYQVYEEEQTRECYLLKSNTISMEIQNIDDINTILSEAPRDYILYISYKKDKDILNLEKKLKDVIDDYKINDIVYYIDITRHKNDINYLNKINSYLNTNIQKAPAIIYVKDNTIESKNIIQSNNKLITANDFESLLKKQGMEK